MKEFLKNLFFTIYGCEMNKALFFMCVAMWFIAIYFLGSALYLTIYKTKQDET